jgi:predicted Ser/Thr protein kinase
MATPGDVAHTAWCNYNGQGLVKVGCALGTRASIGPLPLLELLGEGGFGAVYRTEPNGNSLALKVTRPFSNRDRSTYVTDLENL